MAYDEPMPGHRAAQCVSAILVVVFVWGLAVWLVPQLRPFRVQTVLALVPAGIALLGFAVAFAAAGRDNVPLVPLVVGLLVILGGSAADIYATVAHSPDLKREANPVLRVLLDSGHSLDAVYIFALSTQVLWVLAGAALWVGLLRHRTDLVYHMPATGSLLAYFKAGTGGRDLTYRQWCCPFTWSELPRAGPFICWFASAWLGIGLLRYYAAAEWYRLVQPTIPNRVVVCSVLFLVVCIAYPLWLRTARRALPEPELEWELLPFADEFEVLELPPDAEEELTG
jgi:uncharacterized membrane protein YidH (DUF202 family)